jgi:Tol biopolymer transport system component
LVLTRNTVLVLVSLATACLLACGATVFGVAGPAGAVDSVQNGKILFTSTDNASPTTLPELQTMDPDGLNRVSFSPNISEAFHAEWSPDGTEFAYVSNSGGIVVSSADGTEKTPVPNTNSGLVQELSWSPDGTRIAFALDTSVDKIDPDTGQTLYSTYSSDIYTVNTDGSNLTNLRNGVPPEQGFYWPTWSPDGSKIAFVLWEQPHDDPFFPGTPQEIHTVNADGTGQPTALPNPAYGAMPDWAPDGSKIAYMAFDDVTSDGITGWDVHVMNADGSEQRKVTNDGDSAITGNGAVLERDPDWSPDGTKIAFSGRFRTSPCSPFCEQTDIFTIGIDGSDPANITDTNEVGEFFPSWGPVAAPADTTAPKVDATNPANGAKDVPRATNVRATFSEQMDPDSITKSTFKLFRCSSTSSTSCTTQVTNVTLAKSADGLRATLNPYGTSSTLLAPRTKYKAVVTTGVKDLVGNALDQNSAAAGNQPKAWYFTTGS